MHVSAGFNDALNFRECAALAFVTRAKYVFFERGREAERQKKWDM